MSGAAKNHGREGLSFRARECLDLFATIYEHVEANGASGGSPSPLNLLRFFRPHLLRASTCLFK